MEYGNQMQTGSSLRRVRFSGYLFHKISINTPPFAFSHPSASKLYITITGYRPEDKIPDTQVLITKMSKKCSTRQQFEPKQRSLQVLTPYGISLNQKLALGNMFLEKNLCLI